jgi:hypothetical protein
MKEEERKEKKIPTRVIAWRIIKYLFRYGIDGHTKLIVKMAWVNRGCQCHHCQQSVRLEGPPTFSRT